MNTLTGYSKVKLTDNYLLTAAGGHIPLGYSDGNVTPANICSASVGNTNNYKYHRIAYCNTLTGSYVDKHGIYRISQGYYDGRHGIFKVVVRTNDVASSQGAYLQILWLERQGFLVDSILAGFNNTSGGTYLDLFYVSNGTFASVVVEQISNTSGRGGTGEAFILVNSQEVNNTTTTDKLGSYEVYSSLTSEMIKDRTYTSIVSATDSNTVVGYANNVNNIKVSLHASNDIEYPIIWSNQNNTTSSTSPNLLYKSYPDLTYNPSKKSITATLFKGAVGSETCTIKPARDNEINFGGTSTTDTIYFGFSSIDSRPIPTKYVFGNSATGTATLVAAQLRASSVASSRGVLTINGQGGIYFKYNDTNSQSMTLNGSAFKPFNDANGKLSLGTADARWANIYSTLGNFAGEVTSLTSDTNAIGFTAKNNNGSVKLLAQTNRGVYDATKESWMIYSLKDSLEVYIPRWANKGNSTTPIYFNGYGMPVICALDTKYVISGVYDNKDFASFYDRSFIGSINATAASSPTETKAWFNTIQIAHRNGESDGPDYISQIAIEMSTGNKDRMWFRGSREGSWIKVLSTANSSISDYSVKINNTTKNFVRDWGSGAVNMNDVARGGRSSMGMTYLSTPEGGTATAINPNGATNWHHFINISFTSNGSGNNTWITQIANKAGTTDLWVRSRYGGTISDTTAWPAPWTRILTGTNYTLVLDSVYQAKGTYLTSHQTIYNLTMLAGVFSAVTFDPNGAAKTVNIPTKTSHLTNDSGYLRGYTRSEVGNAPKFDDPGFNGFFEVRSSTETPNETGVKPFNAWGPMLTVKCETVMFQLAGTITLLKYRAKQAANVTLANVAWKDILTSDSYTEYTVEKDGTGASGTWGINVTGSAGSVAWSNVTSKPTLTNVSYTAATANIDHPILFANNSTATSTPTTGAVYYEANSTAGTGLTYNPSTNTIKMPDGGIITTTGTNAITLKLGRIEARTSSTDNTYSAGTSGLVLKTNGNNVYWANDNNSNSWRAIKVGNTSIAGTGTNTYALKFVQGTGITITGASGSSTTDNSITITNSGVRSVATGDNNGTIKVNTGGTSTNVSVKGLGSNAYTSTAYLPLAGGTMSGSIYMGTNNYIYGANESSGAMLFFDGKKTIIGSIGASTTEYTLIRSKDSIVKIGSYTALHSGNSEVSGGGSSLGSSITVKINGTSKTLTIPSVVDKANGINLTNLVTGAPTNPIKVWVGTANLYTKATKDSSTLYFIY